MIRETRHCVEGSERYKVIIYPKQHIGIGADKAGIVWTDAQRFFEPDRQGVLDVLKQFHNENIEFVVVDIKTNKEILTKDYTGVISDSTEGSFVEEIKKW